MIHHGDCLEVLRTLADNSVDSVVTDPPYGLSFMGKKWDYDVPSVEVWAECLRVLKPGGHLLAFAGTRTQHRMAVRIEDAGFEIRDMIAWVYGSGFPKSLNVAKAIGDEDAARQWQGWGTALKPALETVTLASKPFPSDMERDTIMSNLSTLEARLWLLSFASAADQSSASNPSGYVEACAIARWTADDVTNTRDDLCGQMDTSLYASALNTSLSIVSSWRNTLAEVWRHGSTSTTETKSSTITDLKTLRFSLSEITPSTIIRACSLRGGFSANASTAESHFNASLSLLQSIHTLSATAPAMSLGQHERRAVPVSPNLDPCIMARKPVIGTVANNVTTWGTGAINVDGGRVVTGEALVRPSVDQRDNAVFGAGLGSGVQVEPLGRFPANLIHDGSDEVVGLFPETGPSSAAARNNGAHKGNSKGADLPHVTHGHDDNGGSAARFFYCAKASAEDRDDGCQALPAKSAGQVTGGRAEGSAGLSSPRSGAGRRRDETRNIHPTVKPTDLMRYLCRLVTPPGGLVLDPFVGSGSTGRGAVLEGFRFLGIEREAEYVAIARARIDAAIRQRRSDTAQGSLF